MTCDKHDYKAETIKHSKADVTTGCTSYSMAEYVTDGWLGSFTLSC